MISSDYQMTFGYGRTDPPYGTAAFPYHRGDDWYMPDGTPIVVNGVQIGVSGHSGFVTGPHCHIGRFVNGGDTNPNSQGWALNNPHVTDIGYDDTDGNYVGLLDSSGVRWVYLHMLGKSTNVKVGDYLDNLPKYEEASVPGTADNYTVEALSESLLGHSVNGNASLLGLIGQPINDVIDNIRFSDEGKAYADRANTYGKVEDELKACQASKPSAGTVLAPGTYTVKG